MFEYKKYSKLFFWSLELLAIASLILVASKISFLFEPVGTFFQTLFAPVLVAGFLYYMLSPVIRLLEKFKVKRIFAIITVFLLLIVAIVVILLTVIPNLVEQISSLAKNMPAIVAEGQKLITQWAKDLEKIPLLKEVNITQYITDADISYGDLFQQFLSGLSSSLGSVVSTVASIGVVVITAPFILFYMLKDGDKFVPGVQRFFPKNQRDDIVVLLGQLNKTLSGYISGQVIECLFVGTFTFLGYLVLGIKYAFLLGVIAGFANLIPYIGPYIGLAPAVLITVFDSPYKAILCCVVALVVQQIDGNVIYPNVIGKTLQIHPLTIILVLLVAGNLSGILGIFLGVPIYAVARTVIIFIAKLVQQRKKESSVLLQTEENDKSSQPKSSKESAKSE